MPRLDKFNGTDISRLEEKQFTVLKRFESTSGGVYRNGAFSLVRDQYRVIPLAEPRRRPGWLQLPIPGLAACCSVFSISKLPSVGGD